MSEIKATIGTDIRGKNKINATMKDMVIEISGFGATDDTELNGDFIGGTKRFTNMVDFIQYIIDNGEEMLENISEAICDYELNMPIPEDGFMHIDISDRDHINVNLSLDADFIGKEIQEDKKALKDIQDIADSRVRSFRGETNE